MAVIYATHDRGAITLAQLFGLGAPVESRPVCPEPSRTYEYPEGASVRERHAIRLDYILAYMREEGACSCAEIGDEFGIIAEAAYKDLMRLRQAGKVAIVEGTRRPVLWEAIEGEGE